MAQRGHLFPWVPVALACGIGLYFTLPVEPDWPVYAGTLAVAALAALAARLAGIGLAPICLAVALVGLGLCVAGLRAQTLAEAKLGFRYYGPVEGRIVGIDRSGSDAVRLTLDRVVLARLDPDKTPARVRVSLHGSGPHVTPRPGLTVILTGHLSPPGGPVEPGGFDFQRHAWFQKLGAVGYNRSPVLAFAPPASGQWLFKARMALSARIKAALPGETGGFAAAIMTGDRSGIGQETLTSLRVSNLAHLLAISGLHMGLLAGVVFGGLRLGFAAIPFLALRLPAKKLSAIGSLVVASFYLALSGGNVATERAFVMVAVMLCAVLADRRALSLRAVALAATIMLILRPEALLGPGFQMSFAATTALVAVFNAIRDNGLSMGPRWLRPVLTVVISSGVAGLATAPIAAAHFNQIAHYGLVANLLSVPLMSVLVMPMAVVAVLLMPIGLDWLAFAPMGLGLDWILGVAARVSALDGARGTVPRPDPMVLPLLSLGILFVILWQGRSRLIGLMPVCVAVVIWGQATRPDVLISETGGLVGVMTDAGRALSTARGAGFVATNWLENDGDAAEQEAAHARWDKVAATGWPVLALRGKRAAAELRDCAPETLVVLTVDPAPDLPCRILTPKGLRDTGALALYRTETGIREVTARDLSGDRLWNRQ
nr:ComEC/Rec2 family competence protein [Roseovarius aestuariivivens]